MARLGRKYVVRSFFLSSLMPSFSFVKLLCLVVRKEIKKATKFAMNKRKMCFIQIKMAFFSLQIFNIGRGDKASIYFLCCTVYRHAKVYMEEKGKSQ